MTQTNQNAAMQGSHNDFVRATAVFIALATFTSAAFAATNYDTSDPMGSGICYFVGMITGKWIFGVSVLAFIGCMLSFMSGVEMNEFMKKLASVFAVITGLLAGVNIIKAFASFFGNTAFC